MANFFYAMEENALNNFVAFKTQMEKLRAIATPAQIDKVKAAVEELRLSSGQSFEVDEDTGIAIISISGTLTPRAEICTSLSDGSQTLYSTIIEAVAKAERMPSVTEIHFLIDSPGGFVSGLDPAAIAVRDCKKPTVAMVAGMACSAAYWLATQCDRIVALTPVAEIGSIGVLVEAVDRSEADKNDGLKRYVLTSRNAPEKFQDVATEDGRNKIIARLTEIESIFISRVADGRNIKAEDVKNKFGKGGVLIAEDALKVGMIDAITESNRILPESNGGQVEEKKSTKEVSMKSITLEDFLKQNPEAKVEFEASKKAAIAEGVAAEKARINSLLDLSGSIVSDELKSAIEGGQDAGAFAQAELKRQNEKRSNSESQKLGTVAGSAQLPKDTKAEKDDQGDGDQGDGMTEEEARAEAKNFGGKKQ